MKKTYFISDLHLEIGKPEIAEIFLKFMQTEAINADALYILGDFFEVWIGDEDNDVFINKIKLALKTLTQQGIPVYFIHGNRDFLIGNKFAKETGIKLLSDPSIIDLYGYPTLIMHGDLLCTDDKDYLRFRKIVRNKLVQFLFLLLPIRYRKKIARKLRMNSQKNYKNKSYQIMDAVPETIKTVMSNYKVNFLIHGHTHRPNIHYFWIQKQLIQRIVLSDWETTGHYLLITDKNSRKLSIFK